MKKVLAVAKNPYLFPKKKKSFCPLPIRRTISVASYVLGNTAFCCSLVSMNIAFTQVICRDFAQARIPCPSLLLKDFLPSLVGFATTFVSQKIYSAMEAS